MKTTFPLLFLFAVLMACDPIYTGTIVNDGRENVTIKLCNLKNSRNNKFKGMANEGDSCYVIVLKSGEEIDVVNAAKIATPIRYKDLEFDQLEIITKSGIFQ